MSSKSDEKVKHFAIFDIFGKTKSEIVDIKRENGVQYLPFYMTMFL